MNETHLIIEKLGAKIDSLQAEKKELLEMLENCHRLFQKMSIYPITNKIESLIQKHK